MPFIRTAHGDYAERGNVVVEEDLPLDEIPPGRRRPTPNMPVDTDGDNRPRTGDLQRYSGGQFAKNNTLSATGGSAKKGSTRLAVKLSLSDLPATADFKPYATAAEAFRQFATNDLAAKIGGGHVGVAPSSIIASASVQLAWSRYLTDRAMVTGDVKEATLALKFAEQSKKSLATAHALCALETRDSKGSGRDQLRKRRLAGKTE